MNDMQELANIAGMTASAVKSGKLVWVVRCKECCYGEKANAVYLCGKNRGYGIAHEPDWFCADGERKSDQGGYYE